MSTQWSVGVRCGELQDWDSRWAEVVSSVPIDSNMAADVALAKASADAILSQYAYQKPFVVNVITLHDYQTAQAVQITVEVEPA